MNKLPMDKQISVIGALVEGCSIRSVERMTSIHRDTIMRLGVRVGEGCTRLMDQTMRNLTCRQIQVDEQWSYVGKKQRHVTARDDFHADRRHMDVRGDRSRYETCSLLSYREAHKTRSDGFHE